MSHATQWIFCQPKPNHSHEELSHSMFFVVCVRFQCPIFVNGLLSFDFHKNLRSLAYFIDHTVGTNLLWVDKNVFIVLPVGRFAGEKTKTPINLAT